MIRKSLLHLTALLLTAAAALTGTGCDSVDDDRIPYAEVRLTFMTVGDWNFHGVKGDAADYKRYILTNKERVPADFPYTALDRTGYGGLLLVTDVMGDLHAYDLACPYDVKPNVRIEVPSDGAFARCPLCGSTFDIFGSTNGGPLSGPAADRGYALKRYHISSGGATEYRVVTR